MLALVLTGALAAAVSTGAEREELTLTVYNQNFGLVREVRQLELPKGDVTLEFSDVAARIQPYYLHHPDLAPGTGHFRVSVEEGRAIYSALRDRVSGLALPHYVIDIPGGVSKANAAPSDVVDTPDGQALRGRDGKLHPYKG